MLTPGIYYPTKNAHRQLLNTLPGRNIYPVGQDYIYYSEGLVYYVNQNPDLPVGDEVAIHINGILHGTTTVLDATGLYVYAFAPTYGVMEVKSVFSNATIASQNYFCINLYSLLSASANVWSEQRKQNILLLANQYLAPQTTGIFRGQADQQAMSDTFGAAIGFPQPADWPFERYALAMGGYPALGLPSIYGALPKGSSVGAIRDIVQAVTGYEMVVDQTFPTDGPSGPTGVTGPESDFRGLQGIGWQLGHTAGNSYRFRYSGNTLDPVLDRDPNGVSGPHYFLPYNQFSMRLSHLANLAMPMHVGVDSIPVPPSQFYAQNEAGQTTVWIAGVHTGDPVAVMYIEDPSGITYTDEELATEQVGLAPICMLQSNIQQAYTFMLNIVHDGFFIPMGDVVLRRQSGSTDYLTYNWLNPWSRIEEFVNVKLDWQHEHSTITPALEHALFPGHTAQPGSEFIAVNGHFLYPSQYGYTGTNQIQINPDIELVAGDFIQLDYRVGGSTQANYQEVVGPTPAYPYVVTLPVSPAPLPYGSSVFVNGNRLAAELQYTFIGNHVNILAVLSETDRICVRYYIAGLDEYSELSGVGKTIRDFVFTDPVDPSSVMVFVNGERGPLDSHTVANPYTVRLSANVYDQLGNTDITSVTANTGVPAGYSVKITQAGITGTVTTYIQGENFLIDYTHGKVLWQEGVDQPAPGSSYLAYYTYFPKQILEQLLRLVQPAMIKTILRFTTTDGREFNPYMWDGQPNPSGDVIA